MRYNLFHQVHQGLRSLLYETALQLQRTDFAQAEEAGQVLESLNQVTILFDRHAHTEDTYIFPLLENYEPSVADLFEREHVKDHLLSQLLSESMKLYASGETNTERMEAGRMIQSAFNKFLVFNLGHMLKEEEVLNPLIWNYYSDRELYQVTQTIIREMPCNLLQTFNECMMRGLNNDEITGWLKAVEQDASPFVFQQMCNLARQELPAQRLRKVLDQMAEGAAL